MEDIIRSMARAEAQIEALEKSIHEFRVTFGDRFDGLNAEANRRWEEHQKMLDSRFESHGKRVGELEDHLEIAIARVERDGKEARQEVEKRLTERLDQLNTKVDKRISTVNDIRWTHGKVITGTGVGAALVELLHEVAKMFPFVKSH